MPWAFMNLCCCKLSSTSIQPRSNECLVSLDDEYRLVGTRCYCWHEVLKRSSKIYKADWNVIKFLYLICRLAILMLWPAMAYMFASGHGGDDCSYWVYPQAAIYTVMVDVLSILWTFLTLGDIDDFPSLSVSHYKLNLFLPLTFRRSSTVAYLGVHWAIEIIGMHLCHFVLRLCGFGRMGQRALLGAIQRASSRIT